MKYLALASFLILLLLSACEQSSEANTDTHLEAEVKTELKDTKVQEVLEEGKRVKQAPTVDRISGRVIQLLKEKNWDELSQYVHSERGVCFTPEVYVSKSDQVFMPVQLKSDQSRREKRNWGEQYGREDKGQMNLEEYYDRYVMDVDFTQADSVFYDKEKQWGNSINNARKAFESPYIVEYYIAGVNPAFGGMDWRALRLVFSPDGEGWGLVGIVHAAWSP